MGFTHHCLLGRPGNWEKFLTQCNWRFLVILPRWGAHLSVEHPREIWPWAQWLCLCFLDLLFCSGSHQGKYKIGYLEVGQTPGKKKLLTRCSKKLAPEILQPRIWGTFLKSWTYFNRQEEGGREWAAPDTCHEIFFLIFSFWILYSNMLSLQKKTQTHKQTENTKETWGWLYRDWGSSPKFGYSMLLEWP